MATSIDGARADLDDLATVMRGQVRIGATHVLGPLDLTAAMAQFRRRHPGVTLTLRTGLIAELLGPLDGGEIDIAIGPVQADLPGRHLAHRLVDERLVLITPPDHPEAGRHFDTIAAVSNDAFVCLPEGSGLHAILIEAAAAEGFVPRIEFQTHSPASIRELVSAGFGDALLARSAAQGPGPPITVHALKRAPKHPPIGLIHRRSPALTPAARALHDDLLAAQSPHESAKRQQ